MNLIDFEEKMNAFSFRQHQHVAAYYQTLRAAGFTLKDLEQYLVAKREQFAELEQAAQERRKGLLAVLPQCPKCGESQLMLRPVRVPQGPRNRYGYRSCLECLKCAYEHYYKQSPEQVILDFSKRRER